MRGFDGRRSGSWRSMVKNAVFLFLRSVQHSVILSQSRISRIWVCSELEFLQVSRRV